MEIIEHEQSHQKDIMMDILVGGTAGSIGVFIGYPFDIVKVRIQSQNNPSQSSWSCFLDLLKSGGIKGIYKGSIAPIVSQIPTNALIFAGESIGRKIIKYFKTSKDEKLSIFETFFAGTFGGLLQSIVLVPSDVIKCRMQVDVVGEKSAYSGILDCGRKVYKSSGIRGLYQGMMVTCSREIPSIGVYFLTYRKFVEQFSDSSPVVPAWVSLIGGGVAGSASWFCVYPFDVIKTNIQIADGSMPKSTFRMGLHLYQQFGWSIFVRGLGTTIVRAFPVNAATFFFYEQFRQYLGLST